MIWLLRLYPRGWQQRYGREVAEIVATERRSLRLFVDLLAGAIDARINPQRTPTPSSTNSPTQGTDPMSSIRRLCAATFTPAEHRRSAAWMLGSCALFTALGVGLDKFIGESMFSKAILYAAFPMALILSSWGTYLKVYSRAVRTTLVIGALAVMFLFMLTVTSIAEGV